MQLNAIKESLGRVSFYHCNLNRKSYVLYIYIYIRRNILFEYSREYYFNPSMHNVLKSYVIINHYYHYFIANIIDTLLLIC